MESLARHAGQLDFYLNKRAEHSKAGSRVHLASLLSEAVGLINRARAALTDELRAHPELPQDLVSRGLRYWDSLVAARSNVRPKK